MDPVARIANRFHRAVYGATQGRIGGKLGGMAIVVLTTTGRKSGDKRQTMVGAPIVEAERVVLVASFGGAPNHPQWFMNLVANPNVEIKHGDSTRQMRARVATGEEQAELWSQVVDIYRGFDNYQAKTKREIPVVVLEPR